MRERGPRLLFLAYNFPPAQRVGGVREYNTAKHLTLKGWEVTVVTPDPTVWSMVERPHEVAADLQRLGIRPMLTKHGLRTLSPWALSASRSKIAWAAGGVFRRIARPLDIEQEAGWRAEARRATAALLPEDVDLIYASGPPFSAFRLAKDLARRLGRPYVVGYRDLWSHNPHAPVRREATVQAEGSVLEGASAVIAVSPGVAESLRKRFPVDQKIHVITNGYDPGEFSQVEPRQFGHFAIVYAGVFYPPKRVIDPVVDAIRLLKAGMAPPGVDWAFHYYGTHGEHVSHAARHAAVQDKVVVHGSVSRKEALSAVRGAGVAIVITSVLNEATVEERGIVTGKVFDAIGLGTPIVAIAPNGSDLETILAAAGMGRRFAGAETDKIARFLADSMRSPSRGQGTPEAFSWPVLGKRVDEVLRSALVKRPNP